MESLQALGVIIKIFDEQIISEKFKKREFVLETGSPEYPEYVKFEFTQDKTSVLDNYMVNDPVRISFNLKGRKWTDPQGVDKWFNTLQCWKINPAGEPAGANGVPVEDDMPF